MGTIILGFSLSVSGLVFGFTRGWSYSFCILAVFPVLILGVILMQKVL
jgi:hypothetical protein